MSGLILDSVHAKLTRAAEHRKALENEIGAWIQSGPYAISKHINAERTHFRIVLDDYSAPNVRHWAVILGDFVHNLRSALDHLFSALAEKHSAGRAVPIEELRLRKFPIHPDPASFRSARLAREKMLPSSVWAAIEAEQPYQGKAVAPYFLTMLSDLDNSDKHHTLPVLAVLKGEDLWHVQIRGRVTYEVGAYLGSLALGVGGVEKGTEIASLSLSEPPDMDPDHKFSLSVEVPYAPRSGSYNYTFTVPELVERLSSRVTGVVERISASVT